MSQEIKQAIAALERGLLRCRYGSPGTRDVDIAADRTAIATAIQSLRAFDCGAFAERVRQDEREEALGAPYVIDLLVAAGHVTEQQVAKAREIAAAILAQPERAE